MSRDMFGNDLTKGDSFGSPRVKPRLNAFETDPLSNPDYMFNERGEVVRRNFNPHKFESLPLSPVTCRHCDNGADHELHGEQPPPAPESAATMRVVRLGRNTYIERDAQDGESPFVCDMQTGDCSESDTPTTD